METQIEGSKPMQSYVLSPGEMDSLSQSYAAYAQILGAQDSSNTMSITPMLVPSLNVNRPKLTAQAQQIKRTLDECAPQPVKTEDKDTLFARAKWLEGQFQPYLETRAEIHVKSRDKAEWQSAMEKARIRTQVNPLIEKYIAEWQYIMRRLNPGDSSADSLHKLRKDK